MVICHLDRFGVKIIRGLLVVLLSFTVIPGSAETLWTPDFPGYGTGVPVYNIGDVVRVIVNTESSLKYKSSRADSEKVIFEFEGGDTDGLFSFLPKADTSGTVKLEGDESISVDSTLAARIVERDDTGILRLQGTHSLSISGAKQILELNGWIDPVHIGIGRTANLSNIADMRLIYTTLLDSSSDIISAEDLVFPEAPSIDPDVVLETEEEGVSEGVAVEEIAAQPSSENGEAAVSEEPALNEIIYEKDIPVKLSEEKARELLLLFMNRFLEWVF